MEKYGDSMEEFDLSECGRNCVYAEREATSMGYDYLCHNEAYNQAIKDHDEYDDPVYCCDCDHEPDCGHFEKRN